MDRFNDEPGFRAEGNDSDNRAGEHDVVLLNASVEWDGGNVDVEELKSESFVHSPSPLKLAAPKPPMKRTVIQPQKPPVISPTKPPMSAPSKPPVRPPSKPPMSAPSKPPVSAPSKPPVSAPSKPPVRPPSKPPVNPPLKPPSTAPSSGGASTLSSAKQSALTNFVAPVAVAYTVNQLTGERSIVHPQGSQQNADGSVTHPNGAVALPDGTVKHPGGGITKPDGLYVAENGDTFDERTGVYTFADGVIVQAVKNSRGTWEFPGVKGPEASKDNAVAPSESSIKNPDASPTISNELHTYDNGDTFDLNTGVFTYFKGASVQYVKNSNNEWEYPGSN